MYKALVLPVLVSLLLHGVILAAFIVGWESTSLTIKKPPPSFIKAKLVTIDKPAVKKKTRPKNKTTKKSKDLAKQKAKKETEKKRLAKQREETKRKATQRKESERKEQQRKKELAEKEKREQQERLQRETEQELAEALAQEDQLQIAETDAQLASSYIGLITEVIQNNWNRPPSARNNMETVLVIQLVPAGDVVSVKVVEGSGNTAFDRSAENAVLKAARFPELQQLPTRIFEKYFRTLRIKFKPEDLRL
jgi:colicin import membrane protein